MNSLDVIPAKAGIHISLDFIEAYFLDSGFRRSDDDFSHSLIRRNDDIRGKLWRIEPQEIKKS